jgi:hypothetical protein
MLRKPIVCSKEVSTSEGIYRIADALCAFCDKEILTTAALDISQRHDHFAYFVG